MNKKFVQRRNRKPCFSTNVTSFMKCAILSLFSLLLLIPQALAVSQISIDLGPSYSIPGTFQFRNNGKLQTTNSKNIPAAGFKWSRMGSDIKIPLKLSSGTFDIYLAFIESNNCQKGSRTFHIYINDQIIRESFDIFSAANGCRKATIVSISSVNVSLLKKEAIQLRLVSVSKPASISFVKTVPSAKACVPITQKATILAQHLAHAVPGEHGPLIDHDRNKFERVFLDGRESHTHFSYSGGSGKIISYEWSLVETGKVISRRASFWYNFPLGTTRILLSVVDDACTQDSVETAITVTGTNQAGQYCYFYRWTAAGIKPGALLQNHRPVAGAVLKSLNTVFPVLPITKFKFIARCVFFVTFDKSKKYTFSVTTDRSGSAHVYEGSDLVLDSQTSSVSKSKWNSKGMVAFEVIYSRTNAQKKAVLRFTVDGKIPSKVSHDRSTTVPIISAIDPESGVLSGGTSVRITGYGLYQPLEVLFGNKRVVAAGSPDGQQAIVKAPANLHGGTVKVTVNSGKGPQSNAVSFRYTTSMCENVAFRSTKLSTSSNGNIPLNQPTSVAVGNDNRLYFGLRSGLIQVVSYDYINLKVTNICKSNTIRDPRYKLAGGKFSVRTILGITFDPRDKIPRPYVGVSTLYWGVFKLISSTNKYAWSNGAIERFKPASASTKAKNPTQCLEYDRNIVRNLPVSDGDHAINELEFTQYGDLLIAVGANTNSGLPSYKFGGRWENIFSGSVLIARLSRGSKFNGEIPYKAHQNMEQTTRKSGYSDVAIHASGLRNLFSLMMARNGRVYGVDMGPNCGYGNASTNCNQYKPSGYPFVDSVGSVPTSIVDKTQQAACKYGPGRGDKLVEIKGGKYYGHPNIQRALKTGKTGECTWIDPKTGKPPNGGRPPSHYQHPISYFPSAKTGVREYNSNLFCGKLRGNLIMSKNSGQGTFRVIVGEDGKVEGSPFQFASLSGIRVVENVHGDLFLPKYFGNGVGVLKAKVSSRTGLFIVNVHPFRHGRRGGTPLTLGGWGFKKGLTVLVGGRACKVTKLQARQVTCTIPAWNGGNPLVSVSVNIGRQRNTLGSAIRYMLV